MKIILIDNYDSFTFNLYHYLSSFAKVDVLRNDKVDHHYILRNGYNKIVISPLLTRNVEWPIHKA